MTLARELGDDGRGVRRLRSLGSAPMTGDMDRGLSSCSRRAVKVLELGREHHGAHRVVRSRGRGEQGDRETGTELLHEEALALRVSWRPRPAVMLVGSACRHVDRRALRTRPRRCARSGYSISQERDRARSGDRSALPSSLGAAIDAGRPPSSSLADALKEESAHRCRAVTIETETQAMSREQLDASAGALAGKKG